MLLTGKPKAFTLIELLLVLVIISILAGMVMPSFRTSMRGAEFKSFVDKLYVFLDYARSRATIKNTTLNVKFDDDRKEVTLQEGADNINHITVPEGIDIKRSEPNILFYPDGTSRQFELLVEGAGAEKTTLVSRGFDGKIKIQEYANGGTI